MPFTAQPTYVATATFRDAEGKVTTVKQRFMSVAGATTTVADVNTAIETWANTLAAMSDAALYSVRWSQGFVSTLTLPAEVGNGMNSAEDKALVVYADGAGGISKLEVPAPNEAIMTADLETVNPASAQVSAFTTLVTADQIQGTATIRWSTAEGLRLSALIAGYRKRVRTRRKFRPGIAVEQGGD